MSVSGKNSYDIVVAGSGPSGSSAAVEAAQAGLSVLLVDKAETVGGCGVFTEGLLGLQTEEAKAQGIDITPDEVFKAEAKFSNYRANLPILRNLVDSSKETADWLKSLGVKYDGLFSMGDGKPVMQAYTGGGDAVINGALIPAATKLGVEILTSTALVGLSTADDGSVNGVTIRNERTGETQTVSTRSVVVGTGGYVNNEEMLREYTSYDIDRFVPLNHGNATGDGTRLMWSVGARKYQVGTMMVYSGFLKDPDQPTFAMMNQMQNAAGQQPLLWVNERAQRFVNEDVAFNLSLAGNANLAQGKVFSILSQANIDRLITQGNFVGMALNIKEGTKLDQLQNLIDTAVEQKKPYIFKADSIAELARVMGVAVQELEETVARYNRYAEVGRDEEYHKDPQYLLKVEGGPFYGFALSTSAFATMGGVEVTPKNEVVGEDRNPIGGLYATGNESSGMVVGDTYGYEHSGLAVLYSYYSGRNAAKNATEYLNGRS